MKFYVFTAALVPENEAAIEIAKKAVSNLENFYELNAEATGCYQGAKFLIKENNGNIEIAAEDDSEFNVVQSCMDFAAEQIKLTYQYHIEVNELTGYAKVFDSNNRLVRSDIPPYELDDLLGK